MSSNAARATTLPGLLIERAGAEPNHVVLRFFRHGKWNEITYSMLLAKAAKIGSGLAANGVSHGDVVAVIAEDGPLCFAAELGAQGVGAVVLALDPDLDDERIVAALESAGAVIAIVGDQEQFDKVSDARESLPKLRALVVDATRGLRNLEVGNRPDHTTTLTLGQLEAGAAPALWTSAAAALTASDTARRNLDGSVVTHGTLIDDARTLIADLAIARSDVLCALHAFAQPFEHALSIAGPLLTGSVLHFRGRASTQQALAQVQPTIVHATEGWLQRVATDVERQSQRVRGVKRLALDRGLRRRGVATSPAAGSRANRLRMIGIGVSLVLLAFFWATSRANDVLRIGGALLILVVAAAAVVLSGNAVAAPLRRRYGLARCRAIVGSEPPSVDGAGLLGALDVPFVRLRQELE